LSRNDQRNLADNVSLAPRLASLHAVAAASDYPPVARVHLDHTRSRISAVLVEDGIRRGQTGPLRRSRRILCVPGDTLGLEAVGGEGRGVQGKATEDGQESES
jgi:hypothetical protein